MEICRNCGEPLTEEQLEAEEEFCSNDCRHESECDDNAAAWFEDAAYGRD